MKEGQLPPWHPDAKGTGSKPVTKVTRHQSETQSPDEVVTRMSAGKRFTLWMALIVMIPAMVLGLYGLSKIDASKSAPPATIAGATMSASATDCPDSKPVVLSAHPEMKARANGITAGNKEILDVVNTDPQWMTYALTEKFPKEFPDKTDWHDFVTSDNKCFNQKGLLAQAKLLGALTSNDTKVEENVAIPTNLVNTGIGNSGAPVTNPSAGLPSGRVGTKYTFADGTEMYVDHYCGNIPKKSVPGYTVVPNGIPNPPGQTVYSPPPVTVPPTYIPSCEEVNGPQPPICGWTPPCEVTGTCPTTTPPTLASKEPTRAPGNGGSGTGGTVKYGGGGAPPVDGPASAPAVTPSATVAPTSKPVPTATQTQAPAMTVTSVAPTSEKPSAAPSSQAPKASEIPTLPTNGATCGDKRFCVN